MRSFDYYAAHIAAGRSKRDRPVGNNTRAHYIDADTIGIMFHATDVVIYHRDGRIQLNSGGWRTNTTSQRINEHSPARVLSEASIWYVALAPDPQDRKPDYGRRRVLKPFHALDPGPEPVKPDEGCLAGTVETEDFERDVLMSKYDMERGPWTEDDIVRPYEHDSEFFVGYVHTHGLKIIAYGAESWGTRPTGGEFDDCHYAQCPHCNLFQRQHQAWDLAMNGERRGTNRGRGYRQMCEALEEFGSREAWADAYIADFRKVRDQRRAYREWTERNRVPFEDMMFVDSDGYAPRPDPKAARRAAKQLARVERERAKVDKYVKLCIAKLTEGLPMPGSGDCWYCALTTQDGVPMGEAMSTLHSDGSLTVERNYEHLRDHIREGYVVPSMFVNAMRERGYKDEGIYILLDMTQDGTMGGGSRYEGVARDLRRYLLSRLVPQVSGAQHAKASR